VPDDQRETSVLSWIWILTMVEGLKWILQNTQGKIVEISLVPRPSTPPVLFFWGSKADFYQPVARFMCGQLVLRLLYVFLHLFLLCPQLSHAHHIHFCQANLLLSTSDTCLSSGMSSLAQLRVWDTEKQKQLLVMPTEPLTNWVWLPGELLNGLEYSKAWLVC